VDLGEWVALWGRKTSGERGTMRCRQRTGDTLKRGESLGKVTTVASTAVCLRLEDREVDSEPQGGSAQPNTALEREGRLREAS
jgi:hypothetical protein